MIKCPDAPISMEIDKNQLEKKCWEKWDEFIKNPDEKNYNKISQLLLNLKEFEKANELNNQDNEKSETNFSFSEEMEKCQESFLEFQKKLSEINSKPKLTQDNSKSSYTDQIEEKFVNDIKTAFKSIFSNSNWRVIDLIPLFMNLFDYVIQKNDTKNTYDCEYPKQQNGVENSKNVDLVNGSAHLSENHQSLCSNKEDFAKLNQQQQKTEIPLDSSAMFWSSEPVPIITVPSTSGSKIYYDQMWDGKNNLLSFSQNGFSQHPNNEFKNTSHKNLSTSLPNFCATNSIDSKKDNYLDNKIQSSPVRYWPSEPVSIITVPSISESKLCYDQQWYNEKNHWKLTTDEKLEDKQNRNCVNYVDLQSLNFRDNELTVNLHN